MPQYEYQGFNANGKSVRGSIALDSVAAAKAQLRRDGVFVSHIQESLVVKSSESGNSTFSLSFLQRIPQEDISNMTRQLATLVAAHIPLVEALDALTEQIENKKLQATIARVRSDVNEGSSLHQALSKFPHVFSELFISMVESGETSGALEIVLLRLADFLEYQNRLKKKVVGAMIYPILMIAFGLVAVLVIFTFVIPELESVFRDAQASLPTITIIVLWLSRFSLSYWWAMLLVLVFIFFGVRAYLSSARGRRKWDAVRLKLPVFGELTRMIAVSRFTKTLSTLLKSGVPLLLSLKVVKNVVGNISIREAIERASTNLTEGQGISGPLRRSGQFPPMVTHMVAVGERTGEIEEMLERVAEHYEFQVESRIQSLTARIEPLMIIVLAVIVLVIVLAVILPMIELNNAVL
ncbi:MAG: type II secretion system protein GspF [Bradymonadales bacterium]|nr:MAG: type II secretion system protein GspF [Bradymonadales bacterium]